MFTRKTVLLILIFTFSIFLLLTGCPQSPDSPVEDPPAADDGGGGTAPAVSSDASLSALEVSDGTLTPGFQVSIGTYSVLVANSVANFGITPTAGHGSASIKVDGTDVASGSVYPIDPLDVGDTVINVLVTAEDGTTTQDYNVTVTRAAEDSKDITYFVFLAADNAALSSNVSGVITEGAQTIELTVPFGTDVTALVASFTPT